MPPEWFPHECCFMAWPTRRSLWGDLFEQARSDYAATARTIAAFERVVMICAPGRAPEVRSSCGGEVEVVEIAIDDSWTRDSGPIFVTNERGEIAVVDFAFNGWGGKYVPYDNDAALAAALADILGARCYKAPIVLEGGAFFVDGEGTLLTTEGPLLHPERNPGRSKKDLEGVLFDYLGVDKVIWLTAAPDRDTDGHVDGIAQYVRPGCIAMLVPGEARCANFAFARENLDRLAGETDARGRHIAVLPFSVAGSGTAGAQRVEVGYLNCYLANGAVVFPLTGDASDEAARERFGEIFPDREIVGVPGATLSYGGGGPHCITQQMPEGEVATR
ncbi:MAG: agmatine deiminase family protein [Acidimicrobiales bacterium]